MRTRGFPSRTLAIRRVYILVSWWRVYGASEDEKNITCFPLTAFLYLVIWCGREDLNLHGLAPTSSSSLLVCQFQHVRSIICQTPIKAFPLPPPHFNIRLRVLFIHASCCNGWRIFPAVFDKTAGFKFHLPAVLGGTRRLTLRNFKLQDTNKSQTMSKFFYY